MIQTILRAAAAVTFALAPLGVRAQEPLPHVVVFDSSMTPAAGAQGLLTLQHLTASIEDRWLPRTVGEERTRPALALGILYRSAKLFGLDVPQDHMLMVLAHEVFGHGARFRELGDGDIGYGFDPPIPYGAGEAFTSFDGEFPVSPLALMHVSSSGIEAQHTMADAILERAVAARRLHHREAWLYFESRLAGMGYILSASPDSSPGHDVAEFLDTFAEACTAPCVAPTRKQVQQRAWLTLADPLVYYSIYGIGRYVGGAETTSAVPMIPLRAGLRVLPSLGFALAPYGTEWTVRTAFASGRESFQPTALVLRVGNTGASKTWGVGAKLRNVAGWRGLRVDAAADLWRQPPAFADATSAPLRTGAAALASVVLPLPRPIRSRWSQGVHVTAGYKSQGFVPGEQIGGGAVLRVGMQLR